MKMIWGTNDLGSRCYRKQCVYIYEDKGVEDEEKEAGVACCEVIHC